MRETDVQVDDLHWRAEPLPPHPCTLAQAIARVEGWYIAGSKPNRPQRNNNPGDLEFGAFARQFGAVLETGSHPRFAAFPTAADGWACLNALLAGPSYAPLTIESAVNRFAPPVENDTANYVEDVCEWTERPPQTIVGEVLRL